MKQIEGVAASLGERRAGVIIALDASYSMQHSDDLAHLERTIELADEAAAGGNHPFASVLVDANGVVGQVIETGTVSPDGSRVVFVADRSAAEGRPVKMSELG